VDRLNNSVPISVVIITKNEERNIKDALESVRDFDDIVIVDAFSEDGTVAICREYTERVYQREWPGFSAQKQMAVDYAKNEWVFILDADERVPPELKDEITVAISSGNHAGYFVPRKNFFLGKWIRYSGWWPDYTLRLFQKGVSYVEPREVHEKVIVKGTTSYLRSSLLHYTYRTISDYMKKMETYSTLAAKEIRRQGGLPYGLKMLINPLLVFLKMYFLRQGFRDGARGFILATLYAVQTFLKYAKAMEKKLSS
jgi:glycosyltransferase involved in cell wall biosynthesis